MSVEEITDDTDGLDFLDTDWKLATVYTAFLFPKSQQDAIRLIYKAGRGTGGRAPVIHHPVNWIIDARKALMNWGYLVSTDNNLRNSVIKADIEPIIRSLTAAATDGITEPEIREGLRLVLDSVWFRIFFSYGYLHTPLTYRNRTIYEPYRDIVKQNPSGDHLEITWLKNRLFQLLSELGYYSHNIRWMLRHIDHTNEINHFGGEDPALKDLLATGNFDAMLGNHRDHYPLRFIDAYYSCIANTRMHHMHELFPERLIKYLLDSHGGLFMPEQVAVLLRSCPCKTSVRPMDFGYILKIFLSEWRDEEINCAR